MTETLSARTADCLVTVTATYPAPGILDLRYHVQNQGALALYLCNQLREPAAADTPNSPPPPDPNRVHVQVEPEGVHLDKALMDLSFREDIRVLDIPYLTQVLPGQAYEQSLRLALPLHPYRAQGRRPGQAPPVALALRFSLGYFREQQGIDKAEDALLFPTATYQAEPAISQEHQVVTVGPFQELVPVANATPSTAPAPAASPEQWTPWG